MAKRFLSMFILLVAFLVASQQVGAMTGMCIPFNGSITGGSYLYIITDDDGTVVYVGHLLIGEDNMEHHLGAFGERPPGWLIKPNEGGVNIWQKLDNMLTTNLLYATPLNVPEGLSPEVIIENDNNGEQFLRFDFSNTLMFSYDPTPFIADVKITQTEQVVSITTDMPVNVKLIDNLAGRILENVSVKEGNVNIEISHLPIGCRYNVIVEQIIDSKTCIINQENFCKY